MSKATNTSVATTSTLRANRVAAVQSALLLRRSAAKATKYLAAVAAYNAVAEAAAKQAAYQAELKALQEKFGFAMQPATKVSAPRGTGACAQVHAIAAANKFDRKATLAACAAAGINPATAATQYAVAKKAASVSVAA